MIGMDHYEHTNSSSRRGKSIREIAHEPGFHRMTIRKALQGEARVLQEQPITHLVVDEVKDLLDARLRGDVRRPRKQRHTARRVYVKHPEAQIFC